MSVEVMHARLVNRLQYLSVLGAIFTREVETGDMFDAFEGHKYRGQFFAYPDGGRLQAFPVWPLVSRDELLRREALRRRMTLQPPSDHWNPAED